MAHTSVVNQRHTHPGFMRTLWPLLLLMLAPTIFHAQGPKPTPKPTKPETKAESAPAQPTGTAEMTAADVGAFLDGVMP
ncbi:MAG TPA: hypothetical protein VGF08_11800, partial [Terriglobales bacterium]